MRKALLVVILAGASAFAGTVSGSLSFSNTPLLRPEGESEPAVAGANDGTVAVTGLQWLFNPSFFGTHFWIVPSQAGVGLLRMARMSISVTTSRRVIRSFTESVSTMTVSLGTELAT